MGISSALFSGVSGLNTLGNSMSVIGDNIANVNTIGFKSSRSTFETVLAQSIAGASGTSQVGRGVALSAVDPNFSQGSFESTSSPTDMAIGGKGFFMVRSEETGMFYTRAGHFRFDEEGFLVNPADMRVQGWILDPDDPQPRGAITDIQINATSSSPNATSEIDIAANLDSASDILETGASVASDTNTSNGFVFLGSGVDRNDVFDINAGGTSISLIQDGGLEEGKVYSGAEVAAALESALNTVNPGDLYTVTYDANGGNLFEIASAATNAAAIQIDDTGNANDVLGITAAIPIGIGATDYTDEARMYYIETGVNNSFAITVDKNPITGGPVSVSIAEGNYSGDELAEELEREINLALSSSGESVSVDVRYDETNPLNKVFTITSSSRGTGSSIDIDPGTNNLIVTLNISEYDEVTEGSSFTTGGFTESVDPVRSGFYFAAATNDGIDVNGTSYSIVGLGGGAIIDLSTSTGDQVAQAIETTLNTAGPAGPGLTTTVLYEESTDTFTITNTGAAIFTLDWSASTCADIIGFDTTTVTDDVVSGSSTVSDFARAFNVVTGANDSLDISIDDNTFTNAPITVIFAEGVYTGQSLANEMEDAINAEFEAAGETGRVNVTYNDANGIFRIESRTLGAEGSVQVGGPAGVYDIVDDTLNFNDFTVNYGSGFQVSEPDDTANYSTSLSVYDSLGTQHTLSIYFRKGLETENSATWEWFAYVPEGDTSSGEAEVQARGTLSFSNSGVLLSQSDVEYLTDSGGFDFGGNVDAGQEVDIDFGFISGTNVTTQYRAPSSTIFQTQDGYGAGFLQDISVDPDGVVTGNYSNGQVLFLARVALANFTNPWGLSREGGNNYAETRSSGQPITATPGSAGTGKLSPNSLEQSNVDLSREFVAMIIQQRGFQANSKIITTTDQMLSELINLKR